MATEYPTTCPFCGDHHDAVSLAKRGDSHVLPNDGDRSLCFACGMFSIFDESVPGGMRKPTRREQREIEHDDDMLKLRNAWHNFFSPIKII
jgi:hypothetical protein